MRALKWLGYIVGALVALLLVATVAVALFFDPNDYKDRIAQAVRQSTGRELSLPGEIHLSVFPWLALRLGPASLGNPAGFGEEPFATVERVSLRVRVLPLLSRRVEIGRIEIDGLDLRLKQDAAGKGNWEGFGRGETAKEPAARPMDLQLAGVELRDARVSLDDLVVSDLDVTLGSIERGKPTSVELDARLVTARDEPPVDVAFATPALAFDVDAQTLAAPAFEARLGPARVTGDVEGQSVIDAPKLQGRFVLEQVSPRELLPALGVELPTTRDAGVLTRLSGQGAFGWQGGTLEARDVSLRFDDSTLTGRLRSEAEGLLDVRLGIDRLDVDRYLPPPSAPAASGKEAPFELPVELLRTLKLRGQLELQDLRFAGMTLSQVAVGIDARDGVARLAPARARLYGGQYSGEVSVDARPAAPRLSIAQTLTGVDVAALMNDMLQTKRLAGRGRVEARLTAEGRNSDALTRTLAGRLTADLDQGAVEGMDLWYAIAQAQSLLQKRQLAGGENTGRTAFDTFHASAELHQGVATTRDLQIASQRLRVTGQGTANLVDQQLDYDVTATVLKAPPGADAGLADLAAASIPVKITGTFDSPRVRPDLEGLAKQRLKKEVEKRKDKVEEKVRERLRGLFNR